MKHFKVCFLLLLWHITFSNVDGQFFSSGQEQARNPQNLQSPVLNNLMPDQQRSAQFRAKQTFGYGRDEQVSKGVMELAVKIGKAIGKENSKNEIFSPVSIAGALSLLLLGANGKTHDELNKVMGYGDIGSLEVHENFGKLLKELVADQPNTAIPYKPVNWKVTDKCNDVDYFETKNEGGSYNQYTGYRSDSSVHKISVANGLFVQNEFRLNPSYVDVAKNLYKGEIVNLNFRDNADGSTREINNWVNRETHGKIPEILAGGLSPETQLVIASALYFKAEWQEMFIEGGTSRREFYPSGKDYAPVSAELMAHGGCFPYYDDKVNNLRIMGFPYKNNMTTMYIILPNDSSRLKLQKFTREKLSADFIENLIDNMEVKHAVVLFPKMRITNTLNLKNTMQKLGLSTLFQQGVSDLSLIARGSRQTEPKEKPRQPQQQYITTTQNYYQTTPPNNQPLNPYTQPITTSPRPQSQPNNGQLHYPDSRPSPQQTESPIPQFQLRPDIPIPNNNQNNNNNNNNGDQISFPIANRWQSADNEAPTNQIRTTTQRAPTTTQRVSTQTVPFLTYPGTNDGNLRIVTYVGSPDATIYIAGQYYATISINSIENFKANYYNRRRNKRDVNYKVQSSIKEKCEPLNIKDLVLRKRISKGNPGKKSHRSRRQASNVQASLKALEELRLSNQLTNPGLFASQIIHKVDLDVNEKGTEGGAATAISLDRIAPKIVFRVDTPFLILIRHDVTKLPLFYGNVYDPS